MSTTELLTYEMAKSYPIGTVVEDADGYWASQGRRYVKTGESTWALFFRPQPWEIHETAIEEGWSNLSPCPSGYMARVTVPDVADIPGFEEPMAMLAALSIGRTSSDAHTGGDRG